jgi:hypothetical protein
MANIIDNAVRLMNSDESIEVLLQRFFTPDDDGGKFFDFCKVVAPPPSWVAIAELEEMPSKYPLRQPRNSTEGDRELLHAAHQRFKDETGCNSRFEWCMRHWGHSRSNSGGLSFPSPHLMTFMKKTSPTLHITRRVANLIGRSFPHVWMDLQWPACGWMSVTPESLVEGEDYTFESGLAPEWLWQDLGYDDGSWVPGFLEEQSGGRYSPPDQNQLNREEGL